MIFFMPFATSDCVISLSIQNTNVFLHANINKNRVVDRVIRTIRTAFDNLEVGDLGLDKHRNIMQQVVAMYNNSVHNKQLMRKLHLHRPWTVHMS